MVRFGTFELDLRARELRKDGRSTGLREQSIRILALLLEKPGEVVLREKIRKTLWPNDEPDGKLLSLETPHMRAGAGIGPSGGGPTATKAALRDTMCKDMAGRIVKLFRQWTPDFDNDGKTN